MKLTIIFPEYKNYETSVEGLVADVYDKILDYPETKTTPANQLILVKTWLNTSKAQGYENIVIISVSPYVIEAALKIGGSIGYEVIYSDGKNTFEKATPIFKYMAQPMKDMFNITD